MNTNFIILNRFFGFPIKNKCHLVHNTLGLIRVATLLSVGIKKITLTLTVFKHLYTGYCIYTADSFCLDLYTYIQ